ncbi:hypothetical protein FZC35_01390 [Candidatus Cytomitobacter indipagum]|uniref:ADP,ATP carrier protein n=1 Tax=Candidatus Cytomitobacter indipagum TaxID=2601575 RepID=A0A5C0UE93_9PROT|nr:Npt1/Npt2 family nucleotide transporter [Candidatus Cytomitobacter indipagum]QEK38027.1 hypothetical protein FZC35_01390 [Candidatus Cytomitobacter indipagum]
MIQKPRFCKKYMKFMCLLSIMTLTLFNNAILRVIKDTLLFSDNSSIEVVHFIKSFLVMPISMIFVYFYTKASASVKQSRIIYIIMAFFFIFFALYAVLHPIRSHMLPNPKSVNRLICEFQRFKWIFVLYGSWFNALFYIVSELWSAVALNLIFWQFANSINTIKDAKNYYVYFGIFGSIGMVSGGGIISYLFSSNINYKISLMSGIISTSTICIIVLYKFVFNYVLQNSYDLQMEQKTKFKFSDILKMFFHSKYLRYMMMLVFCYHMTSNLVEITWKSILKTSVGGADEYASYMGVIYMISGILSILLFYLPAQLMKRASWMTIAISIPVSLSVLTTIFYTTLFKVFRDNMHSLTYVDLMPITIAGSAYYICNRFLKYALFDPVKEMAYIPLKRDEKLKGKAMIDVFGGKFSKALSGYIQAILLTIIPNANQISISYYTIYIVIACMILWIFSARNLSYEYEKISLSKQ